MARGTGKKRSTRNSDAAGRSEWAPLLRAAERKRYGWGEKHEQLASTLKAQFGNIAYWQLPREQKRERFRALGREIARLIFNESGRADSQFEWAALLEKRFGGLDFWALSADWKELAYEQVVHEVFITVRISRGEPLVLEPV